jgi:hypothetical protein
MGGPSGIAFASISGWLDERHVFRRDDRDFAFEAIQRLDGAYLKLSTEKMKKKTE